MALSWNEIKHRALQFSKNWEDGCNEKADASIEVLRLERCEM